jgi:hypothetical protein
LPPADRQPGERVSQRPVALRRVVHDLHRLRPAALAIEQAGDRLARRGVARAELAAQRREEAVQSGNPLIERRQPVPGQQQSGRFLLPLLQRLVLVVEQFERQLRVEQRVVELAAPQPAVLVMLDQVVVRVAREGQRVDPQRIDYRQRQQAQPRLGRG